MPLALLQQQALQRPISPCVLPSTLQRTSAAKYSQASQAISEVSTAASSSASASRALPSHGVFVEIPPGRLASSPSLDSRVLPFRPGSVEVAQGGLNTAQRLVSAVNGAPMSSPTLDYRTVTPQHSPDTRCRAISPVNPSRCRGGPLLGPKDFTAGLPDTSPMRSQVVPAWSSRMPSMTGELPSQTNVAGDVRSDARQCWNGAVPCTWVKFSDISQVCRKGAGLGSPMPHSHAGESDFLRHYPTVPNARLVGESGGAAVIAALRHYVEEAPIRSQQDHLGANVYHAPKEPIARKHAAGDGPPTGSEALRMEVTPSKHQWKASSEARSSAATPPAPARTPPRASTPIAAMHQQERGGSSHLPIYNRQFTVSDWQPMERVGERSMFRDRTPIQEKRAERPREIARLTVESCSGLDILETVDAATKRRPRVEDIVNFYRDKPIAAIDTSIAQCEKASHASDDIVVSGMPCHEKVQIQVKTEYLPENSCIVAPWEKPAPHFRTGRRNLKQPSLVSDEVTALISGEGAVSSASSCPKRQRNTSHDFTSDIALEPKLGATIAQLADGSQKRAWDAGEDAFSKHASKTAYWKDWISHGAADIDCTVKRRSRSCSVTREDRAMVRVSKSLSHVPSPTAERRSSPAVSRKSTNGGESRCARSASPPKNWREIGLFDDDKKKCNAQENSRPRSPTPSFTFRPHESLGPESVPSQSKETGEARDVCKQDFWRRFNHHTGSHCSGDIDQTFKKNPGEFSPLMRGRQCRGSDSRSVELDISRSASIKTKDGHHSPQVPVVQDVHVSPQAWRKGASKADLALFDRSQEVPRTRTPARQYRRWKSGSIESEQTLSRCSSYEASSCASTAITAPKRENAQTKDKGSPQLGTRSIAGSPQLASRNIAVGSPQLGSRNTLAPSSPKVVAPTSPKLASVSRNTLPASRPSRQVASGNPLDLFA